MSFKISVNENLDSISSQAIFTNNLTINKLQNIITIQTTSVDSPFQISENVNSFVYSATGEDAKDIKLPSKNSGDIFWFSNNSNANITILSFKIAGAIGTSTSFQFTPNTGAILICINSDNQDWAFFG